MGWEDRSLKDGGRGMSIYARSSSEDFLMLQI